MCSGRKNKSINQIWRVIVDFHVLLVLHVKYTYLWCLVTLHVKFDIDEFMCTCMSAAEHRNRQQYVKFIHRFGCKWIGSMPNSARNNRITDIERLLWKLWVYTVQSAWYITIRAEKSSRNMVTMNFSPELAFQTIIPTFTRSPSFPSWLFSHMTTSLARAYSQRSEVRMWTTKRERILKPYPFIVCCMVGCNNGKRILLLC